MLYFSCNLLAKPVKAFQSANQSAFLSYTKILFICISLLFACNAHSDQSKMPAENVTEYKLLVLGDSLSAAYGLQSHEGWVSLLANEWQQNELAIEVVNAAISGDTTDGGLARLPRLLKAHQPTHIYIELGGNNGLQGHNPRKIKQNLIQMVELSVQAGVTPILQEMQIPTNYGARYTKIFNQMYHDIAEQFSITLIPFFLQEIALESELMQNDGIHPTKAAQSKIVDFMSPKLSDAILSE